MLLLGSKYHGVSFLFASAEGSSVGQRRFCFSFFDKERERFWLRAEKAVAAVEGVVGSLFSNGGEKRLLVASANDVATIDGVVVALFSKSNEEAIDGERRGL
jgi:hypothetical protein